MKSIVLFVEGEGEAEAAARFYEALGLRFQRHAHGSGPEHYASDDPGCLLEIYPLRPDEPPTTSTRLGFQVASIAQTLPALLAAGGQLLSVPQPSPWGQRAILKDPAGHRVELTSPVAEQQTTAETTTVS